MQIKLIPQYRNDSLDVVRAGDALIVNGETYDFGPLPNGATLPSEAIDCPFILGDVERDSDGVLRLSLLLPIQRAVFHDALQDINDPADGQIELPVIKELE
ncbi:hypothetical protein RE432_14815 [Pusillimonas sp. SM2304]|uniref:hypothetical protein n=1 Tax=Pusillimonas sp. SM2304 TaxID=3073241 RepID=UPI0028749809|nr:hypothetical protein [Pusillimonas sp. SM2304]MDS1141711.1 hypothetical protein [Pusillimonas sp. SM2304]